MNALEAASLVMIPSGYEDGTLGSLKPTDGTGDFTFSRGSDISATRVNEDGYIEKGYENLLLQSNSFDTTWLSVNADTPTGGQSGYDGSNDAWLLNSTGTEGRVTQSISQGNVQSFSVYAKANTNNWICIIALTSPIVRANFDLNPSTTGSRIGVTGNDIDTDIEDVGNGWFRCSVTYNATIYGVNIYSIIDDNVFTGTGSVYIQDAMLNQGLVAYPYVETTTAPVAGGILEDMPRLDYSGSCPALLLEPQRTNLIRYSEWIGSWSLQNISVSIDDTISPEGYANVSKLTAPSTGFTTASQQLTFIAGTTYTFSAWIKNINATTINFVWYDVANQIFIDLVDNVNTESFTRVSISFTPTNTSSSSQVQIARGLPTGQSFYIYGFQVEQDATYPTSYIPTYGTSQTRLGDVCVDGGDVNTFNSTEGVLYAEISALANENVQRILSISDNTSNNTIQLGFANTPTDYRFFAAIRLGGAAQAFLTYNVGAVAPTFKKCAIKYKQNDFALWIDGVEVATDTSGDTFPENTLNTLSFTRGGLAQHFYGNVKQVFYFPTALSDDECIELTTI